MDTRRISTGKRGEDMAADYLRRSGYIVLERNFRSRYGEIDIIAKDPSTGSGQNATLVFIEVKTRSSNDFGTPLEAITSWKLNSLLKTVQYYLLIRKNLPQLHRVDAVAVLVTQSGEIEKIELVKNITG